MAKHIGAAPWAAVMCMIPNGPNLTGGCSIPITYDTLVLTDPSIYTTQTHIRAHTRTHIRAHTHLHPGTQMYACIHASVWSSVRTQACKLKGTQHIRAHRHRRIHRHTGMHSGPQAGTNTHNTGKNSHTCTHAHVHMHACTQATRSAVSCDCRFLCVCPCTCPYICLCTYL